MDIYFYDFDLNLVFVLPVSSQNNGYISMNCKIEFNGDGSVQLLFWDRELERLVSRHPEGLIIKWGQFEGFTTGYQFEDVNKRIYGMHLNGLLYKSVIMPSEYNGKVNEIAADVISKYYTWLNVKQSEGDFTDITYKLDKPMQGNKFFTEISGQAECGYRTYIDWENKKYMFELLEIRDNPIRLSEDNLNAYEFKVNYDGKNIAFGGWYQYEPPKDDDTSEKEWRYIESEKKVEIYKQDVILSAKNEQDALTELKKKTADSQTTCKTRNIKYNTDYKLGDRLKVLKDNDVTEKIVFTVNLWHEKNEYKEEPVLE